MPVAFNGEGLFYLSTSKVFLICVILNGVFGTWVDPDTPSDVQTTTSYTPGDTREYKLVSFCFADAACIAVTSFDWV